MIVVPRFLQRYCLFLPFIVIDPGIDSGASNMPGSIQLADHAQAPRARWIDRPSSRSRRDPSRSARAGTLRTRIYKRHHDHDANIPSK
jgi:hypothetical protein